jgi:hypothetical protein
MVDGVKYSFLIEPIAITVFKWVESGFGEVESGCRVDIQRLSESNTGTYAATPVYHIGEAIWRGDFFTLEQASPGSTDHRHPNDRAHHHISFGGQAPADRSWDEALTGDPVGWFANQLSDLAGLLRRCGADDAPDPLTVSRAAPAIIAAVRACMPSVEA